MDNQRDNKGPKISVSYDIEYVTLSEDEYKEFKAAKKMTVDELYRQLEGFRPGDNICENDFESEQDMLDEIARLTFEKLGKFTTIYDDEGGEVTHEIIMEWASMCGRPSWSI